MWPFWCIVSNAETEFEKDQSERRNHESSHIDVAIRVHPKSMKVNTKVINPEKKKEFETYVLRNVTKDSMYLHSDAIIILRKEILQQFGDHLVSWKDFAVGFMKNSSKVTIRSSAGI